MQKLGEQPSIDENFDRVMAEQYRLLDDECEKLNIVKCEEIEACKTRTDH